ncbi:MAG: response regulator [Elusimicrobia bacterium]|nr:response regulator [Elusimicrobiota bacterium]
MPRLLIIDDDANLCRLLSENFTDLKYEVVTANNGAEGLETARTSPPDAVILDIDMPGLNGYEVCARLRAKPETKKVPILMLTGTTNLSSAMKGLAAGANDFLTKPFDVDEVAARLSVLLSSAG